MKIVSISSCGIRLPLCVPRTSLPCIVAQISVLVMTNADGDEQDEDEQVEQEDEDEEDAKR